MQTVKLNLVKPSPNPIRKSWDESKMDELAQSIKEQGVIVPIKVRPAKGTYEVVYGHRRIEAAKRAGLEEIPAIVEEVENTDAIWQALIENLSSEDMSAYDKGEEIEKLYKKGFSISAQGRRIGLHTTQLLRWRDNYLERAGGLNVDTMVTGSEMIRQVQQVKVVLKDDLPAKQAVIDKAAKEKLDLYETRAVADAYVKADTPELKEAILNTSGKLGDADRILQVAEMKVAGRAVSKQQVVRREKAFQEFDSAVKDFLDSMKMFDRMINSAAKAAKYGKFSPEAKPFTIRKIDRLIEELMNLKEALGNG